MGGNPAAASFRLRSGGGGFRRGGAAEVADLAGVFPGGGEAGSGFGFAEAEDEAVHFYQQGADVPKGGAEGGGQGFPVGDGGCGSGDEFFVVGGFLGEEGGVGGIEAVFDEGGGGWRIRFSSDAGCRFWLMWLGESGLRLRTTGSFGPSTGRFGPSSEVFGAPTGVFERSTG